MIHAAGILFVTPEGKVLFLKRGGDGDFAGYWCLPGGKVEDDETALQAAQRECVEEIGSLPEGEAKLWTRRISPEGQSDRVDFTTFVQKVDGEFVPVLNDEHTGYAWADMRQPPEPLHPGCAVSLARFEMDELGVARAVAAGELASPQQYLNIWFFDIRITGTGQAYRIADQEHVWRPPEEYLNDEFLARCAGLPVIWIHTDSPVLNSDEFAKRIIGTVMVPYIKGDEVWGVARVYDADAIELLRTKVYSTSPNVWNVGDARATLEDGSTVLIEEKPRLLDHIAIVANGVWDKMGDPSGVAAIIDGVSNMPENTNGGAQQDADKAPAWAAQIVARLDEVGGSVSKLASRMDSMEAEAQADRARKDSDEKERKDRAARKDALQAKCDTNTATEEEKAELAEMTGGKTAADSKKDAEEKEKKDAEEKAKAELEASEKAGAKEEGDEKKALEDLKADSAKKDAQLTAQEQRIKQLESLIAGPSDDDRQAFADAQANCDSVAQMFGKQAPRPLAGETTLAFRKRIVGPFKQYSPDWKNVDVTLLSKDGFEIAERQIYRDAQAAAKNPPDLGPGMLRPISQQQGPHTVITWAGSPRAWMNQFAGNGQRARGDFNSGIGRNR